MKRLLPLAACALALAACQDLTEPTAAPVAPSAPRASVAAGGLVEPALAASLASLSATDQVLVIVNYDEAATSTPALTQQIVGLGARVATFRHLSIVLALATPGQVNAIAALPGVQGVYDNGQDRLLLREATTSMRANLAWAAGVTGKGVGVAIMDSGINGQNPDVPFPGKVVQNVKFTSRFADLFDTGDPSLPRVAGDLYVENLANTDLTSGHGTHVAGIVAGSGASTFNAYRGVAPGAHLVGLSVGESLVVVNVSVLQAVDWLLENAARYNIQVVNNSWGGEGEFDPLDPVNEAMRELHDAGITVVFAAGNSGPGENTLNPRSAAPWVISVAAGCKLYVLDPTNSAAECQDEGGRAPALAGFSSRGIPGDPLYHPDITAPGVNIVSTRSLTGTSLNALDAPFDVLTCNIGVQNLQNYTCASGTSMASPAVAGLVALMEEASGGRLTPDQALSILTQTARPLTGYGQWEVGAGYTDAYAAVLAARKLRR
ncbi:MAG TPA: S8 family serine peptidase [Longimicrobiaceae bacterium]|nr:S8 family serine peptidase [Longimicrobiaceae bacterium]